MPSWGHHGRRLTADEIDRFDRWGDVCGAAPKCQQPATCQISYEYRTGQAGRTSTSNKRACDGHAEKFAAKHGCTIGDAPTAQPRPGGVIAAAAAAWAPGPTETVSLRPYGTQWVATLHGRGFMQSGTCWLDDIPTNLPAAAVLSHAEVALGRKHRLVPTGPWRLADDRATVPVAKAEDVDAWAHTRWRVTVLAEPQGNRTMWVAAAVLDGQFRVETWPLGHTHMDLARAVRTAPTEMGPTWVLGEWTTSEYGATTTAHRRKAAPDAA